MRARQEQLLSAVCHLVNALPLWGLLFCGWIWFQLREESRPVRRQAQQAMYFHGLLMTAMVIWMALELFTRILFALSLSTIGTLVSQLNGFIIWALLVSYVGICLYGSWRVLSGQPFRYPLVRLRP
jgi:uncharacterized Tic20 family protein